MQRPKIYFAGWLLCISTLLNSALSAQEKTEHPHFYVGVDMGAALLVNSGNTETSSKGRFALGFYGGYIPLKCLRAGIRLDGWLIEPFGSFQTDPAKGISISNSFLEISVYPFNKWPLFANVSGGISKYINHHPDAYNAKGYGGQLAMGYDYALNQRMSIILMLSYAKGYFNDLSYPFIVPENRRYTATTLSLGFTYH